MQDIMIDLETMGTRPDAAIVAIGAVAFDLETGTVGGRFYVSVDLGSSMERGGTVDAATITWWMKQSDEARGAWQDSPLPLSHALSRLSKFFTDYAPESVRVWGNGAAFDNAILRNAYTQCGLRAPWKYTNDRCFRTVRGLHPPAPALERAGTYHNALDDAVFQVHCLIAMIGGPNAHKA
jgi:exodeoxyribonuclease VIII